MASACSIPDMCRKLDRGSAYPEIRSSSKRGRLVLRCWFCTDMEFNLYRVVADPMNHSSRSLRHAGFMSTHDPSILTKM